MGSASRLVLATAAPAPLGPEVRERRRQRQRAIAVVLPQAAVLLAVALSTQGCSLITIEHCDGQTIERGVIHGTWQGDPPVVVCEDGYVFAGGDIKCGVKRHNCSGDGLRRSCKNEVGFIEVNDTEAAFRLLKSEGDALRIASSPAVQSDAASASSVAEASAPVAEGSSSNSSNATVVAVVPMSLRCVKAGTKIIRPPRPTVVAASSSDAITNVAVDKSAGEGSGLIAKPTVDCAPATAKAGTADSVDAVARKMESWAQEYWRAWNNHSAIEVTAAFAPHVRERSWDKDIIGAAAVGKANQNIFDKKPNISIDVLTVHASPTTNRVVLEMTVKMNDGTNETMNTTEVMEFTDDGKVLSLRGSMAAIADRLPIVVDGGGLDPTDLIIEGLPPNGNDLYLYRVFSPFGSIESVNTELNEDGTCQGVGFVKFMYALAAQRATAAVDGQAPKDDEAKTGIASYNKGVVLRVSVNTPEAKKKATE